METVRSLRTSVTLLLVAVVGVLLATPASAHAQFLSSDPESGVMLTELPASVVMTYSEDIAPQFVDTAVIPPGGEPVTTEAVADGVVVTIDVAGAGVDGSVSGQWQVVARVVSADGHPVEQTTTFELEPAAGEATAVDTAPTTATRAPGQDPVAPSEVPATAAGTMADDPVSAVTDELPGWAGIVLAVLLLAAGTAAVVVQLRRRQPPQD